MRAFVSKSTLCVSVAVIAISCASVPAFAASDKRPVTAWEASRAVDDDATIRTGVAKARDPLDSATSTSVIKDNDIERIAAPSLAELYRNIPGIRVEAAGGEVNNSYTVRGLPLVGLGAKYIALQEDGLPVLQLGDFTSFLPDSFIRADLNVGQIEAIRGGSASTFVSNAPGAVINLISKTGEVEGGSVQVSSGLDYDTKRFDADYGGHLGDGWRFHIGGFYRQGEGPRETGYTAVRGGQFKGNITREFSGGYVRFSLKLLDDQVPNYQTGPVAVRGTAQSYTFEDVPNYNTLQDSAYSRNMNAFATPLGAGHLQDGYRFKTAAFGMEGQLKLGEWVVSNRFRYANQRADASLNLPIAYFPATVFVNLFTGGAGGTLSYATGPNAGQEINPLTVNNNGLIALGVAVRNKDGDFSNVANDLRASRVWKVGGNDLTTTVGLYIASQKEKQEQYVTTVLHDVVGGGKAAWVNLTSFGFPIAQDGVFSYAGPFGSTSNTRYDVTYATLAPYGSFNYRVGKLALGGSIRYDRTKTSGSVGRSSTSTPSPQDLNGDGVISFPESAVSVILPSQVKAYDFSHGYASYSLSAIYRVAEPFSLFVRYSLGGRAAGEATLLSQTATNAAGQLVDSSAGHDSVSQLEGGFKFRSNGIFVNLTGFHARTRELALQAKTLLNGDVVYEAVSRAYRTYGAELEAGIRRGPFSVAGSMTYTGGEITKAEDPAIVGHTPRHQAALMYRVAPQVDFDVVTVGADVMGQTSSYSQDVNLLKMPGYTTVGVFAQIRPVDRLVFSVNASNLFNTRAFVEFYDGAVPPLGVAVGRAMYGRLISGSVRVFF